MYHGANQGQGMGTISATALAGAIAKETTVHSLNSHASEKINQLSSLCERLESFADRLEPQPKPAGAESNKNPPMADNLQGLAHRLNELGDRLMWLDQICGRLERIA